MLFGRTQQRKKEGNGGLNGLHKVNVIFMIEDIARNGLTLKLRGSRLGLERDDSKLQGIGLLADDYCDCPWSDLMNSFHVSNPHQFLSASS
jgi:hypothetical protein